MTVDGSGSLMKQDTTSVNFTLLNSRSGFKTLSPRQVPHTGPAAAAKPYCTLAGLGKSFFNIAKPVPVATAKEC